MKSADELFAVEKSPSVESDSVVQLEKKPLSSQAGAVMSARIGTVAMAELIKPW